MTEFPFILTTWDLLGGILVARGRKLQSRPLIFKYDLKFQTGCYVKA
jgi:hypothetical protein